MVLIRGQLPEIMELKDSYGSGYGYGYGYGSGYGYGYGYGSGDGYGYGSGYGSGSGSGYGSGYGSGDGSGDGYGSGSGDGDGYGSGDGYGYGSGDGYGSGSGSGYGSGSGDGYGYGSGDGYGYGSGDGYGYGSGERWEKVAAASLHGVSIPGDASFVGFWRSDQHGKPSNGGSGTVAAIGLREKIGGPLKICTHKALHCTTDPNKWKGERLWIVALFGNIQRQEDKAGALEREFLCEVKL